MRPKVPGKQASKAMAELHHGSSNGHPHGPPVVPRLVAVRHRVDVALASSQAAKVLRPNVHLTLRLSDGSNRQFEATPEAFQRLRYCVAQAVRACESLEENERLAHVVKSVRQ